MKFGKRPRCDDQDDGQSHSRNRESTRTFITMALEIDRNVPYLSARSLHLSFAWAELSLFFLLVPARHAVTSFFILLLLSILCYLTLTLFSLFCLILLSYLKFNLHGWARRVAKLRNNDRCTPLVACAPPHLQLMGRSHSQRAQRALRHKQELLGCHVATVRPIQ